MPLTNEFCSGECCRTTRHLGVCAHQYDCGFHVNTDNDHRARHTYNDPTGNEAVNNIMRDQKRNRR